MQHDLVGRGPLLWGHLVAENEDSPVDKATRGVNDAVSVSLQVSNWSLACTIDFSFRPIRILHYNFAGSLQGWSRNAITSHSVVLRNETTMCSQ